MPQLKGFQTVRRNGRAGPAVAKGLAALKPAHRPAPHDAWLMTMVDLTAILVCMFVLIFSTQTLNKQHWQEVFASLQATFMPRVVGVVVVPQGFMNAAIIPSTRRPLMYLDTLLRQRLASDPAWQGLMGVEVAAENQFRYVVPPALANPTNPAARAAWQRLGGILLNWRTAVAVRVVLGPEESFGAGATRAWALAELARQMGARVTAEVVRGKLSQTQWILYGSDF
jgi:hypothetical protein